MSVRPPGVMGDEVRAVWQNDDAGRAAKNAPRIGAGEDDVAGWWSDDVVDRRQITCIGGDATACVQLEQEREQQPADDRSTAGESRGWARRF
jgi:hypothetical protein